MHIGGDKVESIGKTSNLTKAPTTNVEATNLTLQGSGPTVITGAPIKLN
jgi:hypothetical protein